MDKSGNQPLQVPGFGDIPLDYELLLQERYAHGTAEWIQVPAVTVRELAMVAAMNTITDQPDWYVSIQDEKTIALWRSEAKATSALISDKAWEWCLAELRDKANEFRKEGYVRVLDTGSCICKSDKLITDEKLHDFRAALDELFKQHLSTSGPFPQSMDVVDPTLFPLVYGKTRVLQGGGTVHFEDVLNPVGEARPAPQHSDARTEFQTIQEAVDEGKADEWRSDFHHFETELRRYYWSSNFQCLPCELEFTSCSSGTALQITSYINNLHPSEHQIYRGLEAMISAAVPLLNECIIHGQEGWTKSKGYQDTFNQKQRGRVPLRIVTYGATWNNGLPAWALSFSSWWNRQLNQYIDAQKTLRELSESPTSANDKERRSSAMRDLRKYAWMEGVQSVAEPTDATWSLAEEYLQLPEPTGPVTLPAGWRAKVESLLEEKAGRRRYFEHPEPGTAFSYEEWKTGQNVEKAVVNMIFQRTYRPGTARSGPTHQPYGIRLEDSFRKKGLQVIVRVGGIELTPEHPRWDGDRWKVFGHGNERIAATAVFAFDVQNIKPCRMSFRQQTAMPPYLYRYEAVKGIGCVRDDPSVQHFDTRGFIEELHALGQVFGFSCLDLEGETNTLPFQNIGSLDMPQGRLATFPNVMESRWEVVELDDTTRPGHYRYIMLHLVDPHNRICSTRNVPPQQHSWWALPVRHLLVRKGLPMELATEITDLCHDWPMNDSEAERTKDCFTKELKWYEIARHCNMQSFHF